MNIGQMHIRSRALGRHVTFSFTMPDPVEAGPPPYLGLLQLHGASDDYASWLYHSKIATHVGNQPLVVIMPDGGLSMWGNTGPREHYEQFLIEDLLPICETLLPVRSDRWAIGGLSMGGAGALRLAFKYPHRFGSVFAHSSGVGERKQVRERLPELSEKDLDELDIYRIASQSVNRPERPVVTMDCGTEDFLIDRNRAFHTYLEQISYPHTYKEHPGAHTWEYWDEHVPEAITQHLQVLGQRH